MLSILLLQQFRLTHQIHLPGSIPSKASSYRQHLSSNSVSLSAPSTKFYTSIIYHGDMIFSILKETLDTGNRLRARAQTSWLNNMGRSALVMDSYMVESLSFRVAFFLIHTNTGILQIKLYVSHHVRCPLYFVDLVLSRYLGKMS